MQRSIESSKKISIEFDLEEAFQILLAMTDVMRTLDGQDIKENTMGFYTMVLDDITKAIQKEVIG